MKGAGPLALPGLGLVGITAAGLLLHRPGAITLPSLPVTWAFAGLLGLATALYLLAVRLVMRRVFPAGTVWLVLGVALALRALLLPVPPFLSSDVFRYVWDGRVQAAGINPYRYVPADPALAALRDAAVYPHINRAGTARTIYPPGAQVVFRVVAAVSPTVVAMKAAMVGFELLGMAAVLAVLRGAGLPPERVLIYAWNPLAVWAFAGNGHVDAIGVGLIGLALLACCRGRDTLTGGLLGWAVLVKFLPLAMAPAFWRRWDWRLPLAGAAVMAALYLPYLSAGRHVLGFLGGYAAEEHLASGGGFWLLAGVARVAALPPWAGAAYLGAAGLALAGLAWRMTLPLPLREGVGGRVTPRLAAECVDGRVRPGHDDGAPGHDGRIRSHDGGIRSLDERACGLDDGARGCGVMVARRAALLGAAAMLALSPHYDWYYPWLALPCCIAPVRGAIWLSAAAGLLIVNPWNEHFLWPCLLFVPAIVLLAGDAGVLRRSPPCRRP